MIVGERIKEISGNKEKREPIKGLNINISMDDVRVKGKDVEMDYSYTANYDEAVGKLQIKGTLVAKEEDALAKKISDSWKKDKRLPEEYMTTVLSAELTGSGIYASVLCPGTIQTPIIENGHRSERWAGNYSEETLKKFLSQAKGMDPDLFAEKSIRQIAKRKPVIAIPLGYKTLWWLNRLSPPLAISLSHKIYQYIIKQLGESE